ncbi:hypothetical protein KC357_g8977 [Hortaea werneckii]|nr:hypothetical protein KC357_g8977 [Hortaea werneckii]
MASIASPLADKLPPELRQRIYKEVLRAGRPLVVDSKGAANGKRFNASIFLVSRRVFLESSDIFFEVNTIHIRSPKELKRIFTVDKRHRQDLRPIRNVRYLGLVDTTAQTWFTGRGGLFKHIEKCRTLPKLKELSIHWDLDGQYSYNFPPIVKHKMRIAQRKLIASEPGARLAYIDVGVSELELPEKLKILFVSDSLRSSWERVSGAGQIDIETYKSPVINNNGRMDPALWCAFYDADRSGEWGAGRSFTIRDGFYRRSLDLLWVPIDHGGLPRDLPLRDVTREAVPADVLEWLSELLASVRPVLWRF